MPLAVTLNFTQGLQNWYEEQEKPVLKFLPYLKTYEIIFLKSNYQS